MFKQLIIIFSMISILGAFTVAQEKPETEKKDCSHSCCGTKESKSEVKADDETSSSLVWNKVCPVEGNEIKSDSPTFEHNGKLIGFCCEGCDSKFKKTPESFLKNLNEDGSRFISKS